MPVADLLVPEEGEAIDANASANNDQTNGRIKAEGDSPVVLREKTFNGSPIGIEEALNRMELVGHDFYLFIDEESSKPSVVYRRKGWSYGVIALTRSSSQSPTEPKSTVLTQAEGTDSNSDKNTNTIAEVGGPPRRSVSVDMSVVFQARVPSRPQVTSRHSLSKGPCLTKRSHSAEMMIWMIMMPRQMRTPARYPPWSSNWVRSGSMAFTPRMSSVAPM